MATEWEAQSRSHPRLRVSETGGASLSCENGSSRFEVFDVSMAGLSFVVPAGRRPHWLVVGHSLERVVLHLANTAIHGETVTTHITPLPGGELLVGARFYPATEVDHDGLTTAVVRLERGDVRVSDPHAHTG